MPKMSFQALKDLFPFTPNHYISPDGLLDHVGSTHKGSKRSHRHVHNQTWKPPVSLSPKVWKKNRRDKINRERKLLNGQNKSKK